MGKIPEDWTPFAENKDGELFVETRAVMGALIPLLDGIRQVKIGKHPHLYLYLDDAIEWAKNEQSPANDPKKYEEVAAALEQFKAQVAAERETKNKA